MRVPKLYLSTQAYQRLLLEVLENFHTETGGVLLGLEQDGGTYVVEILDPGPEAVLEPAYFEYDYKYLTHLANKRALSYKRPLRLLGLWHRHPGSYDTFSSLDHRTNSTYVQICGGKAVSGLVNLDPHLRMTFYQVTGKGHAGKDGAVLASYQDQSQTRPASVQWNPKKGYKTGAVVLYRPMQIFLGDGHFPPGILDRKTPRELEEEVRRKSKGDLQEEKKNLVRKIAGKIAPKPKADPQPQSAELLLQAVQPDLDFLEDQPDYSYQLRLEGGRLHVRMSRVTQMAGYPPELSLSFLMVGGAPYLESGGARYPYRPGILQAMINQALAAGPEFGSPDGAEAREEEGEEEFLGEDSELYDAGEETSSKEPERWEDTQAFQDLQTFTQGGDPTAGSDPEAPGPQKKKKNKNEDKPGPGGEDPQENQP